ncbi:hypothetical protein [Actinomycetospora sp. NBRC 106378]|uniref:hypothetical protein n=1 Tax=Actinomycetospora sp. NBRC 106378 TaxID=3032208 RepID=UPI0024A338D5|nr:hypothetical protein [Actinomycetospora sp. NBRC 106378]GLZ52565.1 hypothetical protein Acsp07_21820 [Actinomycetospora sp. NBRC 106378]
MSITADTPLAPVPHRPRAVFLPADLIAAGPVGLVVVGRTPGCRYAVDVVAPTVVERTATAGEAR